MKPRTELNSPQQIEQWLVEWGERIQVSSKMVLIGSGALLWHGFQKGVENGLPENSMDVDPVTVDDSVAELGYEAIIGSEFEKTHGFHVNLMPTDVLRELPTGWEERVAVKSYHLLTVVVPAVDDLLAPKLKRGEPRDYAHAQWAYENRLTDQKPPINTPNKLAFLDKIIQDSLKKSHEVESHNPSKENDDRRC